MAVIDCVCPSRPDGSARHPDGDTVTLRPKLDFRSALHARNTVILLRQEGVEDVAEILASLTEVYLRVGIESWTLVDAKGKAVPVSRDAVRDLMTDHPEAAMTIGDEADELYSEAVISPLVARASTSSPPTPTKDSTSVTNGSSPTPRKRSKPSSTITTRTDGTGTTSPLHAGGYNL